MHHKTAAALREKDFDNITFESLFDYDEKTDLYVDKRPKIKSMRQSLKHDEIGLQQICEEALIRLKDNPKLMHIDFDVLDLYEVGTGLSKFILWAMKRDHLPDIQLWEMGTFVPQLGKVWMVGKRLNAAYDKVAANKEGKYSEQKQEFILDKIARNLKIAISAYKNIETRNRCLPDFMKSSKK